MQVLVSCSWRNDGNPLKPGSIELYSCCRLQLCHTTSSSIVVNREGFLSTTPSIMFLSRLFRILCSPHLSCITWQKLPSEIYHSPMKLQRTRECRRSSNICRIIVPHSLVVTLPPWFTHDYVVPPYRVAMHTLRGL